LLQGSDKSNADYGYNHAQKMAAVACRKTEIFLLNNFAAMYQLINCCINTNILTCSSVKSVDSEFGNKPFFTSHFTKEYARLCSCKVQHYKNMCVLNQIDHTSRTDDSDVNVMILVMILVLMFAIALCALKLLMGGKGES